MNNDTLKNYNARNWFILFCLGHFIVWFLAPTLLYQNPPNDSLEGIAWGNLWQWGYEKHPFLAPWLTAGVTQLFGVVGWPIYFISQVAVVTCFWAIWRLGNLLLSPWQAFIAVVLLEGINYYNISSAIFDPNVLMLPLWAWLAYFFYRAVLEQKIWQWGVAGILAGLAMDCKYESALLLVLLFLLLLVTSKGRQCWSKPGVYFGILLAILVFMPNLWWLYHHHFMAITYATRELASNTFQHVPKLLRPLYSVLQFLLEQVGNILPALLLFIPFFIPKRQPRPLSNFDWRYLLFLGFGPLVFTIIIALLSSSHLVSRWSYPFFSVTSILWLAWYNPEVTARRLKLFVLLVVIFNSILLIGDIYNTQWKPLLTGKATHSDTFPGANITKLVTQKWHDYYHRPLPYIVGTPQIVVNVAAYSKDKPKAYFYADPELSPWINPADVIKKGAAIVVIIWRDYPGPTQFVINYFKILYPTLQHQSIESFPRLTKAKVLPVEVWVAFLPPTS